MLLGQKLRTYWEATYLFLIEFSFFFNLWWIFFSFGVQKDPHYLFVNKEQGPNMVTLVPLTLIRALSFHAILKMVTLSPLHKDWM